MYHSKQPLTILISLYIISFAYLGNLGRQLRKEIKHLLGCFYSFTKEEETIWTSVAKGSLKSCHFEVCAEKKKKFL